MISFVYILHFCLQSPILFVYHCLLFFVLPSYFYPYFSHLSSFLCFYMTVSYFVYTFLHHSHQMFLIFTFSLLAVFTFALLAFISFFLSYLNFLYLLTPYLSLLQPLRAACLRVSPDRSQFFWYESITLSCEDPLNSTGWMVKRKTSKSGVRPCANGWGSKSFSSTCIIENTYPTDSGVYWCESKDREMSNGVNITITGIAQKHWK